MNLFKKLKPYQVDLLLFGLDKSDKVLVPEFKLEYPITFDDKTSTFLVKDGEVLIHKSKIFKKSLLLSSFGFKQPLMTIGDAFTNDEYRGKGIYPAVLERIVSKHLKDSSLYLLVSPENIPSIRGIEKAGFSKVANLKCLKIGPIYLNKKLVRFD
ncbi:hypothetical protein [Algoriphagus sp.]|uniref:GNAT family N-acetyltransferase n=1 Tax=Algoriphagus sp. TaxID=1872435 RepID=UPI0025D6FA49|nr:hypothetical protein [Algoriphagus sp.]